MAKKIKNISENSQSRRWFFTINNEKRTDEEMLEYVKGLEHIKYAAFQRELGEEEKTPHIQMFLIFSIGKRFSTIKKYFPRAHIEAVEGTNAEARDYCTKSETRISGPYEYGEFAEERSRTDIKGFLEMAKNGAGYELLSQLYPSLYVKELNKIGKIYENTNNAKYMSTCRNIEVIYVYGPERVGKTSYVFSQLDNLEDIYQITLFNDYWFTNYQYQKAIFIDEFIGQIRPITKMNKLLEPFPLMLNCKNSFVYAAFEKVYIISNYPLKDVYVAEQAEKKASYDAFCKRINKIIRFDEKGEIHIEKETIWEDIPENERKFKGLTKRASKVYTYDRLGKRTIEYDRETGYQLKLDEELPFDLDKE